jgi:hypothetical protein
MKTPSIISLTTALLLLAAAGCKQQPAAGPAGSWEVTVVTTNAQTRPMPQTLKLTLSGDALTGTLSYNSGPVVNGKAPVAELPITDAKLQGNMLSFNFTHPPASGNGSSPSYTYEGAISGDSIKGTFITQWMDQTHTNNWEAVRMKQ